MVLNITIAKRIIIFTGKMFNYLTRKIQLAFQRCYTDKATVQEIIDQELQCLGETRPVVRFTRNPMICLTDTAEDIKYEEEKHTIRVCQNLISSEELLRSSVAREIYWMSTRNKNKEYTDDQEARNVIAACKKEIDRVRDLDEITREMATKTCAKVQAKRKIKNVKRKKIDSWHFYTRELIENNWYILETLKERQSKE